MICRCWWLWVGKKLEGRKKKDCRICSDRRQLEKNEWFSLQLQCENAEKLVLEEEIFVCGHIEVVRASKQSGGVLSQFLRDADPFQYHIKRRDDDGMGSISHASTNTPSKRGPTHTYCGDHHPFFKNIIISLKILIFVFGRVIRLRKLLKVSSSFFFEQFTIGFIVILLIFALLFRLSVLGEVFFFFEQFTKTLLWSFWSSRYSFDSQFQVNA